MMFVLNEAFLLICPLNNILPCLASSDINVMKKKVWEQNYQRLKCTTEIIISILKNHTPNLLTEWNRENILYCQLEGS